MSNRNDLIPWIRYDSKGIMIPGTLVYRKRKPAGRFKQLLSPTDAVCCVGPTTTMPPPTTTTTTQNPILNSCITNWEHFFQTGGVSDQLRGIDVVQAPNCNVYELFTMVYDGQLWAVVRNGAGNGPGGGSGNNWMRAVPLGTNLNLKVIKLALADDGSGTLPRTYDLNVVYVLTEKHVFAFDKDGNWVWGKQFNSTDFLGWSGLYIDETPGRGVYLIGTRQYGAVTSPYLLLLNYTDGSFVREGTFLYQPISGSPVPKNTVGVDVTWSYNAPGPYMLSKINDMTNIAPGAGSGSGALIHTVYTSDFSSYYVVALGDGVTSLKPKSFIWTETGPYFGFLSSDDTVGNEHSIVFGTDFNNVTWGRNIIRGGAPLKSLVSMVTCPLTSEFVVGGVNADNTTSLFGIAFNFPAAYNWVREITDNSVTQSYTLKDLSSVIVPTDNSLTPNLQKVFLAGSRSDGVNNYADYFKFNGGTAGVPTGALPYGSIYTFESSTPSYTFTNTAYPGGVPASTKVDDSFYVGLITTFTPTVTTLLNADTPSTSIPI